MYDDRTDMPDEDLERHRRFNCNQEKDGGSVDVPGCNALM